jgi:shikimate kinase
MTAKTLGKGFEKFSIEIPLDVDHSEAVLDLAKLKPEAGDHTIAFYGGAVAKYRYYVDAVLEAEKLLADLSTNQADLQNQVLEAEKQLATATEEEKSEITDLVNQKKKSLTEIKAMVAKAEKRVTQATDQAKPKDIVDIVVSEPIQIRVLPGDKP